MGLSCITELWNNVAYHVLEIPEVKSADKARGSDMQLARLANIHTKLWCGSGPVRKNYKTNVRMEFVFV